MYVWGLQGVPALLLTPLILKPALHLTARGNLLKPGSDPFPPCLQILYRFHQPKKRPRDFPGGAVVKNPPANAGDTGLSPDPGRSHMPRSN